VSALGTGDYDGDLIDDLAFVEAASIGGRIQELVAIDFGSRDGLPLPPTRLAELEGVRQLGAIADGGMDVLFACTDRRIGGVDYSSINLFDGSPDRLPFATYTLVDFANGEALDDWFAPAIVLGAFGKAGRQDVLALGTTKNGVVGSEWLLSDIGGQGQPPRLLEVQLPDDFRPTLPQGLSSKLQVAGTAADLDADARDEALWLSPQGEDGCVLLIQAIDEVALSATQRALLELDGRCNAPELEVRDLDADHAPDVLALVGDPSREPRHLEVLWNDGHGGFSLERRSIVADPKDRDLRGFAVLKRPDEPSQLVLVSERSLRLATLGPEPRVFAAPRELEQLVDGRSVVVTDPNGDGLPDIAVADTAGLWLLRARLE
jgi:hypothetical protein